MKKPTTSDLKDGLVCAATVVLLLAILILFPST
jgi:hypothetical protein